MTWLALLLLGAGVADLAGRMLRPSVATGLGVVAVALPAALASLGAADWVAVGVVAAAVVGWRLTGARTERSRRDALLALAALAVPLAAICAFSGFATTVGGPLAAWLRWMQLPGPPASPDRLLLVAALALFNVESANVVVRAVLVAVDARPPNGGLPGAQRLRGGRLLGPMERLLLLGFGASGYLEAAGLVVAGKGILRFPELQAAARSDGSWERGTVDELTEYFLIGTFASVLVALASVALLA